MVQKRWPSDKANHSCESVYELWYIIQVKGFLMKKFTFLALLDIKAFGHLSLVTMLLLIGLTLFLQPGCFCLAIIYLYVCT